MLRIGELPDHEVKLDGILSEPAWAAADSIENLTTIEPEEGGVPAGKTIVKVIANSEVIIIGVLCFDADPSKIVSFSKARDSELEEEDHITIVLDTFLDGRTGYLFAVNPSGARFDGLVSPQGGEVNSKWDALWEAGTSRNGYGWGAEIRIPVRTIGFKKGLSTWGFNVERRVQRLQETSRWSGAKRDYEISQTAQAGLLTEVPKFNLGLGLSVRPTISGRAERTSPTESTHFKGHPSLDLTKKLGPNLLASLTANTDFAETEVDARQTNLTRFEILFPEKRTFFLDGADTFEFGLGLEESVVPFFSRRIGLFFPEEGGDGVAIPIDVGGKLNGRVGKTNLGMLVAKTRSVEGLGLPASTMSVMRVKQNIFSESSVGMIATVGDQLGRPGSWTSGADFTYRNSRFLDDKNLIVGVWGLVTNREGLEGNKSAYGFEIDYPNDLWDMSFGSRRIGDGFDPSLGFVPRKGVHVWDGGIEFNPRPGRVVRQMFHQFKFSVVNNLQSNLESYKLEINPVNWLFESGDRIKFGISPEGDRPVEDFNVFESADKQVTIPAGSYAWRRFNATGTLAEKRRISGEFGWEWGSFYGGNLKTTEGKLALNWRILKLELGAERNLGKLPGGEFTQNLYASRVEFKFSPNLQASSFWQFDNESGSLGSNTRIRWTFKPLGDLFIVYNHNLQKSVRDRISRLTFDSNELVVKFQYALWF